MNRPTLSILVLSGTLLLGACTAQGDPDQMGRGYIAFKEKYKSAPGPEARAIGYTYDTVKNNAVLEDMRYAAADLVSKLDQKLSFSDDKIYLIHPTHSAFYNSFDHLLRDELVKSGYMLSPTPENAVPVTFNATETTEPSDKVVKKDYRPLYLSLSIGKATAKTDNSVGGIYEVPTYDFLTEEPDHAHPTPVLKETGAEKSNRNN
jgi:hypothetical protein